MKRSSLLSGILLAFLLLAEATAETPQEQRKPVTIPLDRIWANKMPGARDIRELEPDLEPKRWEALSQKERVKARNDALWDPIVQALIESPSRPAEGGTARPGFAVSGSGLNALRQAYTVFVNDEKPRQSFSPRSDITLVFFSYPIASGVQLRQVERRENQIEIRYRFVGYMENNLSMQFALIPLGELSAGTYHVKIIQMPAVQKIGNEYKPIETPLPVELGRRFVCQSFSFDVVEDTRK